MTSSYDLHNDASEVESLVSFPSTFENVLNLPTEDYVYLKDLYLEIYQLFKLHDYFSIILMFPFLFSVDVLPPVFNLIIGCCMIRSGRFDGGFREVGIAVRLSEIAGNRIAFLLVLANMYAEINDKKLVQGSLAEIFDTIRMNASSQLDFDIEKANLLQLEKKLMAKLETNMENEPIKCKSFEEQILELNKLKKYHEMDTFTGKCQFIVAKMTAAERILEMWNKDKKPPKTDPLKFLLEAILTCGTEIAYSSFRSFEPILNQYFENLKVIDSKKSFGVLNKTRSVSLFSKRKSSNGHIGENGKFDKVSNEIQISIPVKISIIKAFMCMLRCQYADAGKQLGQVLSEVKDETYSQLNLLKLYCQSKESNLSKKNLEIILSDLQKSDYGGPLREQILATIYEKLYKISIANTGNIRRNKNFNSVFRSSSGKKYFKLLIESYIRSILNSPKDDLFIPLLYDKILQLLILDDSDIRIITFFYQLRYYYLLRADYTYLHVPGLLSDFVPEDSITIKNNPRLLQDITDRIEHKSYGETKSKEPNIETVEEFQFVKFWIREHQPENENENENEFPERIKKIISNLYI